jgi:tripeptide aminopeptidase
VTLRTFDEKELRLFREVMLVQSTSRQTQRMQRFVKAKAKEFGATAWISHGNVYAVKGKGPIYPCVVAHTDTVHQMIPVAAFEIARKSNGRWWAFDNRDATIDKEDGSRLVKQVGIGGDDKCGIYIALNMLRTKASVKAFFPRDEEIGCIGTGKADMAFFDDVSFCIQNDRRGTGDFVDEIGWNEMQSVEFKQAVKPILEHYNFKFTSGMMTDVEELVSNGVGICCANVSCGYYSCHSRFEEVDEHELLVAQNLTEDVIWLMGEQRWEHTPPTRKTYEVGHYGYNYRNMIMDEDGRYGEYSEWRGMKSQKSTSGRRTISRSCSPPFKNENRTAPKKTLCSKSCTWPTRWRIPTIRSRASAAMDHGCTIRRSAQEVPEVRRQLPNRLDVLGWL